MRQLAAVLLLCLGAAQAFADPTAEARAVDEGFAKAVNLRDVASAMAYYADDATAIYTGTGQEAAGKTAIEKMVTALLMNAKEVSLVFTDNHAFPIDTAHIMNLSHWDLSVTAANGTRTSVKGRSSELLVKGGEGRWRFLVDHASVGIAPPPAPAAPAKKRHHRHQTHHRHHP